jgi:hypothetical protein
MQRNDRAVERPPGQVERFRRAVVAAAAPAAVPVVKSRRVG